MEIQSLLPNLTSFSGAQPTAISKKSGGVSPASTDLAGSGKNISSIASLAYTYNISEISYSEDRTDLAYYQEDGSVALRASSHTDFSLKEERISLEFSFSAEALGLTAKDFEANGGKAFQFSFSYQQTQLDVQSKASFQKVETTRSLEDLMGDLSDALREVFRKPGDKSIALSLDDEAVKTLLADAKTLGVFKEILNLISLINSLKNFEGERDQYLISLSGKGKPQYNYNENTSVKAESVSVDFKFTIQPPAASSAEPTSAAPAVAVSNPSPGDDQASNPCE